MSRNIKRTQQNVRSEQKLHCTLQSVNRYRLSATVGVFFSFSTAQAFAHTINLPTPTPTVVHTVQHVVPTHTTVHASAAHTSVAHTSVVTSFNKSTHASTNTSNTANSTTSLNLGSTKANVAASLLGSFKTITIDVGGKADVVKMTSKLTDAEVVGAQQILSGGTQTIAINSKGAADGGTVQLNSSLLKSLDSTLGGAVSAISIPKSLTVDDSVSTLSLSGKLSNFGSLVAQSSGSGGDTISASSIVNAGTIAGKNVDLTLTAPSITNTGTISSNTNVNLNTASLTNNGGTVTATQTVSVSNAGGLSITGGTINSHTLNLNAGTGSLAVNGTNMTGVVNDTAGSAHINAVGNYLMGTSSVLNDPLFSSTGNFTITSAITATNGNALSIIAGGSIYSAGTASLNTSSTTGNGGNLLMVAGANFTVDPTTGDLTITQSNTANGGSATGGSINLIGTQPGGAPITSINTSSTASGFNGGTVTLAAYAGSAVGSGSITLPGTVTIQTGNNNQNSGGGGVTVLAGGKTGTTISLGNIDASGNNGQQILVATATPVVGNGGLVIQGGAGAGAGSVISGGFSSTNLPLAINPGSIKVGNLYDSNNSDVGLEAGGAVTFGTIDTSGYGGTAGSAGSAGLSATAGGGVSIIAGAGVIGTNILTYGGGGGGGGGGNGGNGGTGGSGGNGGNVIISTTAGNLAFSGSINASGGGGGGGGGGSNTFSAGAGGSGGSGGQVTLTANSGSVNVSQGINSADGADGGAGTVGLSGASGGGGGGGGSFGGGGGGGGSSMSGAGFGGGGGGGGLWGGGGGGNGTTAIFAAGGSGAGAGQAGQGPAGSLPTTLGGQYSGGSGQSNPLSGGALEAGGLGANNGSNVIAIGGTLTTAGAIDVTASTGIGTAAAPLSLLGHDVTLSAPNGSIFATAGSDTVFYGLQTATTGTVSLSAFGNLYDEGTINAAVVNMSTLALSSGDISLTYNGGINATTSVSLNASGFGSITEHVYAIYTPTLIANSVAGNIILQPSYGNKIANFQFSTAGNSVDLDDNGNLNVLTSSATGINANITVDTTQGSLIISGAVTSGGAANFQAGTGIAANAQVTAPGGLSYNVSSGTITSPLVITNPGPINLTTTLSSLGTLSVNTPRLSVDTNGGTIIDSYTGTTTLSGATSSVGFAVGNFVLSSAASTLNVNNISNYINVTVSDTNATGSIVLGGNAITATNLVALTTAGGNITTTLGAGNTVTATTLNLVTKTGNITQLGGGMLNVTTSNLAVTSSSTASTVSLFDTNPVTLTGVAANNFTLTADGINITGSVSAPTMNLTSYDNISQGTSTGLISGNAVTLDAYVNIGSSFSPNGLNVTLSGTAPVLSLTAQNAAVQSAGAVNLGTGRISSNLNVISAGTLSQSGTLEVDGSAYLTGKSFDQTSGATFNGSYIDISSTTGSASSVTISGAMNGANTTVVAPSTGTITIAAGGVVDSTTSSFQSGIFTLAPLVVSPALPAGAVDSSNETISATTINLPIGGTLSVLQNGNNGGRLAVTAASIFINGAPVSATAPLTLNAAPVAGTAGNGGSISLTLTGTTTATIGGANSAYIFNAPGGSIGGNGGSIYVKNSGALDVTPNAVALNNGPNNNSSGSGIAGGNGGNLTFIAGTNLAITGNLATTPGNAVNAIWGDVTLSANGSLAAPFTVGNGLVSNGVSGIISAGNVTITNNSGIAIAGLINLNPVAGAATPILTLNTNVVSSTGSITASGLYDLVINSTGNLTLANLDYGSSSLYSVTVNAKGNVSIPTNLLNQVDENSVSLTSTGTLTLPTSMISAAVDQTLNGGTIYISALAQNFVAGVAAPSGLQLNAVGGSGGNGGTVTYDLGGIAALNVGGSGSTKPTVEIDVSGTAAGGGTVNIQNAGAITMGASGLTNMVNLNNNVSLVSTASTVLVNAAGVPLLNINQGNLTLESNSLTTFNVGGTVTTNGIALGGALGTGTFTIGNSGGAVLFNEAVSANVVAAPVTGYAANVFAKGNITEATAADLITGPSISVQSTTGSIGTATTAFIINGTNNTGASGPGTNVSLVSGVAGVVNVRDNSTYGDVLTSGTSGSQFIFNGGGALATQGSLKETSLVDLTAPGVFTQAIGTTFTTQTLDFQLGTMTTPLLTSATVIGGVNGDASVTGAAGTNPTINIIDSTTAILSLGTGGATPVAVSAPGGTISIITGGSIAVNAIVGGGATSSGNTTLTAGTGGTITEGTGVNIIGTNFLSLTSASLGAATKAFNISGGTLYLSTPGIVNIVDNLTGASTLIKGTTVQNISGTVASFTLSATGPITLNNITSTGSIIVNNTNPSGAGGISTNAGTQLISKTGTITLDSSDAAAGAGGLNLQGNVLAANVNLTTGTGLTDNITMGGSVGSGGGTVNFTATGDVIQSNTSNTEVFANTLNFSALNIYGNTVGAPTQLSTDATAINQLFTSPTTGSVGIYLYDPNTALVTVSKLNITGNDAAIDLKTGGNLTITGPVTAGNLSALANAGNVTLGSGMSMTVDGNIGLGGSANTTSIAVGSNQIGLPSPAGSSGLTINGGQIYGATEDLTNGFPSGGFGTSIATNATVALNISSNGSVNITNNSGNNVVTLNVSKSESVNFTNIATAGGTGGLTVGTVDATTNGGGAVSVLSVNGSLSVGSAAAGGTINSTAGNISLVATDSNLGSVNVYDGTTIETGNGSIIVTAAGPSLTVGVTGGNGVTLTSTNGVALINTNIVAGTVTLGDNVEAIASNSGNITITSPTALTIGDGAQLTANGGSVLLTATNGALNVGNPTTLGNGLPAYLYAGNGNVDLESTGAAGSITVGNTYSNINYGIQAYGNSANDGRIIMNATGALNISTAGTPGSTPESAEWYAQNGADPSTSGITLSGSSVTVGPQGFGASGSNLLEFQTDGNISITATGAGGSVNLYPLNFYGSPYATISAYGSGTNTGNVYLSATGIGGSVNIGQGFAVQSGTSGGVHSLNAGNVVISGSSVTVGATDSSGYSGAFVYSNVSATAATPTTGNVSITASAGSVTISSGSVVTTSGSGSISLSATDGQVTVGDTANLIAANGIIISSTGSGAGILVGANGGAGATVRANSGNITLTTGSTNTIEIGSGTTIDAIGPIGLGNVTFLVGTGGTPTVLVTTGAPPNVTVNPLSTVAPLTTPIGFLAAGSVDLYGEGANIYLSNYGTSAGFSQLIFDGNNSVTADPPAAGSLAPVSVDLPVSLSVLNGGGLEATSPTSASLNTPGLQATTGAGLGQSNALSSPSTINSGSTMASIGGISSSGTVSGAASERTVASGNSALSGGSVQSLVGTTFGATDGSYSPLSGASGSAANELVSVNSLNPLNSLNSLNSLNASSLFNSLNSLNAINLTISTNVPSNMQTASVLQTNTVANATDGKLLAGGVSLKGRHKEGDKHSAIVRELPQGALLVAPERLTVVPTPFGTVQVASKSVALIVSNKDGLSVYNLDDTRPGSITISVNGETVSLEPGRHVTITHDTIDRFEQVNPAQYITYRNVRSRGMNGNMKAYHSEFNHLSAIAGLQPLRNMVRSNEPAKRKIAEHMLKTSALLSVMNKSTAPYELMTAPSMTAMK